jgi:hypothetical protein
MTNIVRCPHCGTDFTPPDLADEIERIGSIIVKRNAEIAKLFAAIQRIDGINDNPAHYNPEINAVCDSILRRDQPGIAGEPEPEDQHEESDLKGNG